MDRNSPFVRLPGVFDRCCQAGKYLCNLQQNMLFSPVEIKFRILELSKMRSQSVLSIFLVSCEEKTDFSIGQLGVWQALNLRTQPVSGKSFFLIF